MSWEEWKRLHCMGMTVNSKAVFVVAMEEDEERGHGRG
jgi:hypothetical protein